MQKPAPSVTIRSSVARGVAPLSLFAAVLLAFGAGSGASGADEVSDELAKLHATFDKDIEFATRPIRDRYVSRLEGLKRSLGSRGDARGAAAVQDEIERVAASAPVPATVSKLAGVWLLQYQPSGTRRYKITPEGVVKYEEGNGALISPPREFKIFTNQGDLLIDLGDGAVEKLSMKGNKLVTEIFAPKSLYPKSHANFQGTGTLLSPPNR